MLKENFYLLLLSRYISQIDNTQVHSAVKHTVVCDFTENNLPLEKKFGKTFQQYKIFSYE